MQSVYPDGSDHRAFTDPQHASWPSQSYPAHNGEVEARAITSLTSRQSDYIPDGQAHYHAFDYEHAPIYLPSHHDRYHRETSSSSDDVYLRHRATLNSFPEGLPNSYEVEGLRFNEGCRDHNGQLSGEQYWELSSYCIPAHYDHARHYDAESPSLAGSASHQYGTSFNHYSSEPPTAAATVSQLQCFDGHAGAPLSRSNGFAYGHMSQDDGGAALQAAIPTPLQQGHINERPYRHNSGDGFATLSYDPHPPMAPLLPRFADPSVGHPRSDMSDGTSSALHHHHGRRDSRSAFSLRSPSPPLKRLVSQDSSDGHNFPARPRLDKSPPRRQEPSMWPGPALSAQSVLKPSKKNPEKKQTLACLFCRERKIACGRPAEGSPDHTCNQCARRQFKCEYPKESRRGQHKRGRRKAHDVNEAN